jgi:hypothetical protein
MRLLIRILLSFSMIIKVIGYWFFANFILFIGAQGRSLTVWQMGY